MLTLAPAGNAAGCRFSVGLLAWFTPRSLQGSELENLGHLHQEQLEPLHVLQPPEMIGTIPIESFRLSDDVSNVKVVSVHAAGWFYFSCWFLLESFPAEANKGTSDPLPSDSLRLLATGGKTGLMLTGFEAFLPVSGNVAGFLELLCRHLEAAGEKSSSWNINPSPAFIPGGPATQLAVRLS